MKFDLKWISMSLFIFGGTISALKLSFMKYAFPCFVVGHIIVLYDFISTHKNKPLIIQNIYFLIINSIATYIWFMD